MCRATLLKLLRRTFSSLDLRQRCLLLLLVLFWLLVLGERRQLDWFVVHILPEHVLNTTLTHVEVADLTVIAIDAFVGAVCDLTGLTSIDQTTFLCHITEPEVVLTTVERIIVFGVWACFFRLVVVLVVWVMFMIWVFGCSWWHSL